MGEQLWNLERERAFIELYPSGMSFTRMAEALGFGSKNSLISKAHRLGLEKRGNVPPPISNKRKGPAKAFTFVSWAKTNDARNGVEALSIDAPQRLDIRAEDHSRPDHDLVAFLDLRARHCRYPIRDLWCGRTSDEGCSYCPGHRRIVYRMAA